MMRLTIFLILLILVIPATDASTGDTPHYCNEVDETTDCLADVVINCTLDSSKTNELYLETLIGIIARFDEICGTGEGGDAAGSATGADAAAEDGCSDFLQYISCIEEDFPKCVSNNLEDMLANFTSGPLEESQCVNSSSIGTSMTASQSVTQGMTTQSSSDTNTEMPPKLAARPPNEDTTRPPQGNASPIGCVSTAVKDCITRAGSAGFLDLIRTVNTETCGKAKEVIMCAEDARDSCGISQTLVRTAINTALAVPKREYSSRCRGSAVTSTFTLMSLLLVSVAVYTVSGWNN